MGKSSDKLNVSEIVFAALIWFGLIFGVAVAFVLALLVRLAPILVAAGVVVWLFLVYR